MKIIIQDAQMLEMSKLFTALLITYIILNYFNSSTKLFPDLYLISVSMSQEL